MSVSAILLTLTAMAAPAHDNLRIGSKLQPAVTEDTNAKVAHPDEALYRLMECAVTRRGTRVKRMLDVRTDREYITASAAIDEISGCAIDAYVNEVSNTVTYGADRAVMRGMLAEAFLKKDRKLDGHAALPIQPTYARDWFGITGRATPLDELGVCVADTAPAGIATLLRSARNTPAERAAFAAVAPSLGPCLGAGYKLNANRMALRAVLAEALYHRAYDPAPTAPDATPQGGTTH